MSLAFQRSLACLVFSSAALVAAPALADSSDNGPCGNFDFSQGISCKIEVKGGCTAQCTPFKFVVACDGKCSAQATQTCTGACGTQCIAQCNPGKLDCFNGCHEECDQPAIAECTKKNPNEDCVTQAKAQCDIHCKRECKIQPSNCDEHCTRCCRGGCTTQVNWDCDYKCMAEVKGGCTAKCTKPEGGLFCNGQYVNASDIQQCIAHLATKGVNVDVSARGTLQCDLTGCKGDGQTNVAGCAAAPSANGGAIGAGALALLVAVSSALRGRRRAAR